MWYEHVLVQTALVAVAGGGTALVVAWFSKSKARLDATIKEEALAAEVRIAQGKTDLAHAQAELAAAEAKRTAALVEQVAAEQTKMAMTLDATHLATNSAKTLLDTQIATERATSEQLRRDYTALEKLAAAEKALLKEENRTLQNQLNTLALSLPGTGVPLPVPRRAPEPVMLTDESGTPQSLPLQVTIHDPADEKKEKP